MIIFVSGVKFMELNYHITFKCQDKCWKISEPVESLIQATSIAENITRIVYSNSTFITVNLPGGILHIFCNKPIHLEKLDEKSATKDEIRYLVISSN